MSTITSHVEYDMERKRFVSLLKNDTGQKFYQKAVEKESKQSLHLHKTNRSSNDRYKQGCTNNEIKTKSSPLKTNNAGNKTNRNSLVFLFTKQFNVSKKG